MSFQDQILQVDELYIIFTSETSFAVTKELDKFLKYERISKIEIGKNVKKTKNSIGTDDLNVKVKLSTISVDIYEKKYILNDLILTAKDFNTFDFTTHSRFLVYKKFNSFHVALKRKDFTYINPANSIKRGALGNIFYFKDITEEQYLHLHDLLHALDVPSSAVIFDNFIFPTQTTINDKYISYSNNTSQNLPFYFLNDENININNTSNKPIFTSGFSRNNSHNYITVNDCTNFEELKEYVKSNLNYNKYFNTTKGILDDSFEFFIRNLQLNVFMSTLIVNFDYLRNVHFSKTDKDFNTLLHYLKLRHRLIPFLYTAFKQKHFKDISVYKIQHGQLIIGGQILINPITTKVDPFTNQTYTKTIFDDVYYDFLSGEKIIESKINAFYSVEDMPIFVKRGSIIPLTMIDSLSTKKVPTQYEIKIFPGASNKYQLYYDQYVSDNVVKQATCTFDLRYDFNILKLSITPNTPEELTPKLLHINFANIKKTSTIKILGSKHKLDYNNFKKHLIIDLYETSNQIEIEITNPFGLEVEREQEFFERKLENFFSHVSCDEDEKHIFKYKIRPYLHEDFESLISRINKNIKFLPNKYKKTLHKFIEGYKKFDK